MEDAGLDAVSGTSADTVVHQEPTLDACVLALMCCVQALVAGYLVCSSLSFCSSGFSGAPSSIDSVIRIADVACLDLLSALFVCAGFAFCHLYKTIEAQEFESALHDALVFLYVDVALAALAAAVFGALRSIELQRFRGADVALTLFEGATALRLLDTHRAGWHSLNVAAWPVLCLLWCAVLAPAGLEQV